ncbi:MAG: nucleotidyltransferase domain-containing protein [Candidatus Pacearchaeota archaeon]
MIIPGYNASRPKAEDYEAFMANFKKGLKELGNNEFSLMIYGSFANQTHTPGVSDIDAVLIFPYDVVIPKDFMQKVSIVLCEALKKNYVPFQVAPLDVTTIRDGRFNSFDKDLYDLFLKEGKIIFGPDYRNEMICLETKTGSESRLSHNLRKIRKDLLFANHYKQADYEMFLDKFLKTLDTTSTVLRNVLYLVDQKPRAQKFFSPKELEEYFPMLDLEPLNMIRDLRQNPEKLDELYFKPEEVMNIWNSAVTFFEKVIREYIKKFPKKHQTEK